MVLMSMLRAMMVMISMRSAMMVMKLRSAMVQVTMEASDWPDPHLCFPTLFSLLNSLPEKSFNRSLTSFASTAASIYCAKVTHLRAAQYQQP